MSTTRVPAIGHLPSTPIAGTSFLGSFMSDGKYYGLSFGKDDEGRGTIEIDPSNEVLKEDIEAAFADFLKTVDQDDLQKTVAAMLAAQVLASKLRDMVLDEVDAMDGSKLQ